MTLKELEKTEREAKQGRYKSVPSYAIPKSKFRDKTANQLTQSIIKHLEINGHYASRIQSQGQYNPKLKIWTKGNTRKGIGDIMAIINGQTIMIEVKIGKDRQSKYQKETEQKVMASGGVYLIVKSFDQYMQLYEILKK